MTQWIVTTLYGNNIQELMEELQL